MHILIIVTVLQIATIYIHKMLNFKYRLLEAKTIEVSHLLRAGYKKSVHRVEQRLQASEFIKNAFRSGRPQVMSQEASKKLFKSDPYQKMTRLAQKNKISISTVARMVKKM